MDALRICIFFFVRKLRTSPCVKWLSAHAMNYAFRIQGDKVLNAVKTFEKEKKK
jgi:hypothetical protein